MTTHAELRLAVMEDDTVLCADCVDELQAEGLPETAATIVHAWLAVSYTHLTLPTTPYV